MLKGGAEVWQRQVVNEVLGPLLRSSFAVLAARARHLITAATMSAFSVASRPTNLVRSDISELPPKPRSAGSRGLVVRTCLRWL
jgi:hypothetical protein